MDRRVLWMCILVGSTAGGFAPELWGASAFGAVALLSSALGAVVGVLVARRLAESL